MAGFPCITPKKLSAFAGKPEDHSTAELPDDITYLRGRADGARREGRHDHAAKLDGIADRLAKIEDKGIHIAIIMGWSRDPADWTKDERDFIERMADKGTRQVAIIGGGDWADASFNILTVPVDMDVQSEIDSWKKWLREEYTPQAQTTRHLDYVSCVEYLRSKGAFDGDVEEFEDT